MISRLEIPHPSKPSIFAELWSKSSNDNLVILIHGFKGFYKWGFFNSVKQRLFDHNFNILSFNFSHNGVFRHGDEISQHLEFSKNNFSLEQDDINRVMQYIKNGNLAIPINKIHAIGHSRGAAAMLISQASNKYFIKTVALAPFLNYYNIYPKALIEAGKNVGYFEVINKRNGETLKIKFSFFRDLMKNRNLFDLYHQINIFDDNTMLIHGLNDDTVPAGDSIQFKKVNPRSCLKLIPNASHSFNFDKSNPINPEINKMINETVHFLEN